MATPTNSSGNLVDEFEEAFQHCLNILTKEEAAPASDKDEVKMEVEQTTLRFIDLARQMEAFFLQKRFLLSALKPEMIVKEDTIELRNELARKEELLKRHYEKIAVWQNLLSDLHGYAKSPAAQQQPPQGSATPGLMNAAVPAQSPMTSMPGNQTPNQVQMPGMSPAMQQQMQQQQQLQMQQQQMQHMQQQQMQQMQQQMQVQGGMSGANVGVGPGMVSPQQAMFMQQQAAMSGGQRMPFGQQGSINTPLAFLEKTTSNIDLVAGMTDGRR